MMHSHFRSSSSIAHRLKLDTDLHQVVFDWIIESFWTESISVHLEIEILIAYYLYLNDYLGSKMTKNHLQGRQLSFAIKKSKKIKKLSKA